MRDQLQTHEMEEKQHKQRERTNFPHFVGLDGNRESDNEAIQERTSSLSSLLVIKSFLLQNKRNTHNSNHHKMKQQQTESNHDCIDCSWRSIDTMGTTGSISSSFRQPGTKRGRRVSFSDALEQVKIVENFRLTLSEDERSLVWNSESEEDTSREEQAALDCFLAPAMYQSPKKNMNNKRRRRKGRNTGTHTQQRHTIFGDVTASPRPAEPLVKVKKSKSPKKPKSPKPSKSPLKRLTSRLGLRKGEGKKSALLVPFSN